MPRTGSNLNVSRRVRYIRLLQGAVALVALGLVGALAFAYLFTTFMPWDDEGYFLLTYRDFLSGRVMYDEVFSIYGPLTFFSAALFARFDVANVTHDTFRWILLPFWIAISAVLGGLVWRWTHRFIPSLATILLVGLNLRGLAKSVGHPQVWAICGVVGLLWLGLDAGSRTISERRAFWAGVVIGAIFLFKVNVGFLAFIGFVLFLSFQLKGSGRTAFRVVLTLVAIASGIAVFFSSPTAPHKWFAVAYLLSLAAMLRIAIARPENAQLSQTSVKWLLVGLALCLCIGVGGALAAGATPRALYSAHITMPALLARSYHGPFLEATRKASLLISTIGFAAVVAFFVWPQKFAIRSTWVAFIKVTAGALLLWAFWYDLRLALTGSLPFLCLLVADVPPQSGHAYSRRLLLALLSLLLSLQLYPLAGEQVDWAALLPMTAAAVLFADGMNHIARESRLGTLPRLTGFATGAVAILLTSYLFAFVGGEAIKRVRLWSNSEPVNLHGAHWLRLPTKQKLRLTLTVDGLKQNCHTVLLVPGLYSFSLWSGVSPFEQKRINSWPFLWPEEIQKNELRKIRNQSRGCVLVSRDAYKFFERFGGSNRNKDQLLQEIQRTMRPIYAAQDVTLYGSYDPN